MFLAGVLGACTGDEELMPLVVSLEGHSMSKLPFMIAWDQGLYRKYGLDLELQMPEPEFDEGRAPKPPFMTMLRRKFGLEEYPDARMRVTGHTPTMYLQTRFALNPARVALAATDCSSRYYVVARPGIETVEDLKGKRIGINAHRTTSAFAIYQFLETMGWDPHFDVSLLEDSRGVESIRRGEVDVIVGGDEAFEDATREGYPILVDTREWDGSVAGNSLLFDAGWLEQGDNREATLRFMRAFLEGLVIFHERPELAIDVAYRWYGFPDRELARSRYERADYVPRIPYPCYDGIRNTIRIHDSLAMRQFAYEDFFDDSLLRELIDSGFLEEIYASYEDQE